MEFKITVNVDKNATRIDVKSRLEKAINESFFKWKDTFVVSDFEYYEAYLEGLHKGEEILNNAIQEFHSSSYEDRYR
jgi:hypothetical protein